MDFLLVFARGARLPLGGREPRRGGRKRKIEREIEREREREREREKGHVLVFYQYMRVRVYGKKLIKARPPEKGWERDDDGSGFKERSISPFEAFTPTGSRLDHSRKSSNAVVNEFLFS